MAENGYRSLRRSLAILFSLILLGPAAGTAAAGDYQALVGVPGINAVFDFTHGSADSAIRLLPAIRGVYQDAAVTGLPNPPRTVIVFHGPAVKLITSDRKGYEKDEIETLDKVAAMLRQMKQEGVKLEVCMYAVKMLGIDPATIIPEVDKVGNGFISVLGYQAQGYSLVSIP